MGARLRLTPAARALPRAAAFVAATAVAVAVGRASRPDGVQLALVWPAAAVVCIWLATSWRRPRVLATDAVLLLAVTSVVALATRAPLEVALGFSVVNLVHALVACAVAHHERPGRWALESLADLRVLATAAVAASIASAALGTVVLAWADGAPPLTAFAGLLVRNTISTLLLCALVLRLARPARTVTAPRRTGEAVAVVLTGAASYALSIAVGAPFALVLIVLPLAAWAALRLPTTTTVALTVLNGVGVSLVAVLSTVQLVSGGPVTRVLVSQAFIAVTGALALVLALHRDERSALLARLAESEQRFRLAFASAPTGLCEVGVEPGAEGVLHGANQAMTALLGGEPGASLLEHCLDPETVRQDLALGASTGALSPVERRLRRADGREVWVSCTGALVRPAGAQPYLMLLLTDVTDRRQAEGALRHQVHHDALTGLPNRTLLLARLEESVGQGPTGVLYLDLDGFKAVNDRAGHAVGDLLLQQVAKRLHAAVRPGDTVGRLGGDEFAVVCPAVDDDQLTAVADRLVLAVSEPYAVHGHDLRVTASVGSSVSRGAAAGHELLERADRAMYAAKHSGRDRVGPGPVALAQGRRSS